MWCFTLMKKIILFSLFSWFSQLLFAQTSGNHEYVDLGLPSGTLWATCNVGASSPEEYGDYYAWGETNTKIYYYYNTYKWCNGDIKTGITKYCTNSDYGKVDNLTQLESNNDVAISKWGTNWRMPTEAEMIELQKNCTWNWTSINEIPGYKITGLNNNSIFLPATGWIVGDDVRGKGDEWGVRGCYWTSSLREKNYDGVYLSFYSNKIEVGGSIRHCGHTIRPVLASKNVSSIKISEKNLSMDIANSYALTTQILPSSATNNDVQWLSSNTSVATVQNGVVTAISPGIANIIVQAKYGTSKADTCRVLVKGVPSNVEMVDLGLPSGTLWANMNVGATSPEEYGGYFAWGETEEKDTYNANTYKYGKKRTKYHPDVDDLTDLERCDDAAYVNWGTSYHTPTKEQCKEILDNCQAIFVSESDVHGLKVIGPNGNSLFFPAAGRYKYDRFWPYSEDAGEDGKLWGIYMTSTYNRDREDASTIFDIRFTYDTKLYIGENGLGYGYTVRAVSEKRVVKISKIEIKEHSISIYKNETYKLNYSLSPENATDKRIVWSSSDENVAVVSADGTVTAKSEGKVTVTLKAEDGSGAFDTCEITVVKEQATNDNPELADDFGRVADAIDLGLSVKWSSWNLGASSVYEDGGLYGGGDPTGKVTYFGKSSEYHWVNGESINGTQYDIATQKWGEDWRLPTMEELRELRDKCTWEFGLTIEGLKGVRATGPNGNSIFIPCRGTRHGTTNVDHGYIASIWSGETCATGYNPGYADLDIYFSGGFSENGNYYYCGQTVRPVSECNQITLIDGTTFSNTKEENYDKINYVRNFKNTKWQALYVPFSMSYNDWKDDYYVARLNNVNQYDDDDNGVIDRTVLEFFYITQNSKIQHIEPNTPYLIRAKEEGEKIITIKDAKLYTAEENTFDVTSWDSKFVFNGTYHGINGAEMVAQGYYALGGGSLKQAASGSSNLNAFRWYMSVTDRNGNTKNINEVKVCVFDFDEEETGITIQSAEKENDKVFDLSGRRVNKAAKGIYIKNGKKIVIH